MNTHVCIFSPLVSSLPPFPSLPSQVKKAEIRTLLQNIDKEAAATVTYDEFLDMAAPKVANRDEREEIHKVREGGRGRERRKERKKDTAT